MLNISSILKFVLHSVQNGDTRMTVIDDMHIMDTKTGVEYHLYDDYCKMTYKGENILTISYLTKDEQSTIWDLKQLITDPAKAKEKQDNYPAVMTKQREIFSGLYENPEPVMPDYAPAENTGEEYVG